MVVLQLQSVPSCEPLQKPFQSKWSVLPHRVMEVSGHKLQPRAMSGSLVLLLVASVLMSISHVTRGVQVNRVLDHVLKNQNLVELAPPFTPYLHQRSDPARLGIADLMTTAWERWLPPHRRAAALLEPRTPTFGKADPIPHHGPGRAGSDLSLEGHSPRGQH